MDWAPMHRAHAVSKGIKMKKNKSHSISIIEWYPKRQSRNNPRAAVPYIHPRADGRLKWRMYQSKEGIVRRRLHDIPRRENASLVGSRYPPPLQRQDQLDNFTRVCLNCALPFSSHTQLPSLKRPGSTFPPLSESADVNDSHTRCASVAFVVIGNQKQLHQLSVDSKTRWWTSGQMWSAWRTEPPMRSVVGNGIGCG